VEREARLLALTSTSPDYRLYALPGGPPPRPGLVRVAQGGRSIEVEVYRLPRQQVGDLLAGVPAPLAIGTVCLRSGQAVHGFLCEPIGLDGATDISDCGGWRAYLSTIGGPATQ
jgi:allophanate hydrolase